MLCNIYFSLKEFQCDAYELNPVMASIEDIRDTFRPYQSAQGKGVAAEFDHLPRGLCSIDVGLARLMVAPFLFFYEKALMRSRFLSDAQMARFIALKDKKFIINTGTAAQMIRGVAEIARGIFQIALAPLAILRIPVRAVVTAIAPWRASFRAVGNGFIGGGDLDAIRTPALALAESDAAAVYEVPPVVRVGQMSIIALTGRFNDPHVSSAPAPVFATDPFSGFDTGWLTADGNAPFVQPPRIKRSSSCSYVQAQQDMPVAGQRRNSR